eukprot:CAMPEP_0201195690 /NCGR_PEP_ID=MMETSP0851-20130426/151281_1 /ASSEMBLY_ACC=CAM_ASM_000631 /TAXON_ID=183588 /ORGANISM="Pseudo-nitzschia fraudulenta, Strain WWA7" /LENGTH=31 /DNA_ID= /DNA_START= /DNA_END= /DNA_ORIENTATION=
MPRAALITLLIVGKLAAATPDTTRPCLPLTY